ncbi:mini-chromosome maintenance replisome factor-domain-containing protein [Lentinula edodes]|uniref:Mini-chromosome maintenance replisome factor-domain-containing protein n=1 Tax=Lentinula lateritia TaxID=40482 RepID=A0A9W9B0B8_9AGAR|nr:mini-chromosome maintenance replisome factor-domain-containing protein [Lentinula edodes]
MVSSVPFDVLNDPQAAIQELFDQHLQSQSSIEFHSVLSNHFREIFDQEQRLELIPHLHSTYFARDSSDSSSTSPRLVQFRGMVQDTSASPELYLSQLREGKYGGWGAHESMDEHIDYSNLRECTRYWVVSVPGETEWAGQTRTDTVLASTSKNSNRSAEHKFPLPSTVHIGVHTNIYSVQSDPDLKSTDIATFVGLFEAERDTLHVLFHLHENTAHKSYRVYPLTMTDTHESTSLEKGHRALQRELVKWIADESLAGDMDAAEWVLLSIISRVQSRHPPIIPASLTLARFPPPPAKVVPTASTSDTPDVHRLETSTGTPALYHVLSLLLPIITHVPLSLPLLNDGVFFPESKPRPRSGADEEPEDELYSGLLQLAPSTVCLITDSSVTEGQINDRGVRNLRALQEVIRNQTLEYVFPYSVYRFETDIGCIVCTEGKKSALVETHTTIPLRPADSLSTSELQKRLYKLPDELNLPPIEKLEAWRKLIGGAIAKQTIHIVNQSPSSSPPPPVPVGGIGVSDAAAELIQEEFVQERQTEAQRSKSSVERKAQTTITPDVLIHRMLMTNSFDARARGIYRHLEADEGLGKPEASGDGIATHAS